MYLHSHPYGVEVALRSSKPLARVRIPVGVYFLLIIKLPIKIILKFVLNLDHYGIRKDGGDETVNGFAGADGLDNEYDPIPIGNLIFPFLAE